MPDQIETPSVKQSKAPLYISLAIIAALVLGYFFIPQVQEFLNTAWEVLTSGDKQRTREWVSQFGWFGPIVIVVTMILQMFLLVIPTPLLMVVTVLAYGPWAGAGILFVAVFMASSIGYFIGRYFGPVIVEKLVGHKTEKKIADFIDDYGFWTVIVVRLSPFLSNDAISFVGGVLKMGYWKFYWCHHDWNIALDRFYRIPGWGLRTPKNRTHLDVYNKSCTIHWLCVVG
jgi:uncharacterized membrane protein YdjX (TVP38/TMEM64 family)